MSLESTGEIDELREVFNLLDVDKGGTLTLDEVNDLLRLLGNPLSAQDIEAHFKDADADGSGGISFEEFVQITMGTQSMDYTHADATRAFKMFARKGSPDGKILQGDLVKALKDHCPELTSEEIRKLLYSLEENVEGWIDYQKKVDMFVK